MMALVLIAPPCGQLSASSKQATEPKEAQLFIIRLALGPPNTSLMYFIGMCGHSTHTQDY